MCGSARITSAKRRKRAPNLSGFGKAMRSRHGSIAPSAGSEPQMRRRSRNALSRATSTAAASGYTTRPGRLGTTGPWSARRTASAGFATRPKPSLRAGAELGFDDALLTGFAPKPPVVGRGRLTQERSFAVLGQGNARPPACALSRASRAVDDRRGSGRSAQCTQHRSLPTEWRRGKSLSRGTGNKRALSSGLTGRSGILFALLACVDMAQHAQGKFAWKPTS